MDRLYKRRGRNRGNENRPFENPQAEVLGVNYSASPKSIPPNMSPFAQNADFGNPLGAVAKAPGYEALFSSLGSGKILGLHYWKHSAGGQMLTAWDKYLYLLSGGAGSIAKTSQADWEAGDRTDIDTTSSSGDMKIDLGTAFSETDTLTADFNGTHSNTVASGDKVTLSLSGTSSPGRYYIQNAAAGYDPATERGAWDDTASHVVKKLSKTKSGSVAQVTVAETSSVNDYDVLLLKAVTDPLVSNKTISGTMSWCLGIKETSLSANFYYHVHVFVTQGDTDNVRGTLLSNYIGAAEWSADTGGPWGLAVTDQAISAVNAQTGDRVVIEVGYRAKNTSTSSFSGVVAYGGTSSTDLTDGALASSNPGWIEFSSDLINDYNSSGTYTHGVQDISGVKIANAATIDFNKTTPTNTTLTMQYRISTDSGGSWGSWTTVTSGSTIIAAGTRLSGYRVQWKALLSTSDASVTPSLDDVTVAVTVIDNPTGIWISPVYDTGNTPLTSVLSWVSNVLVNTSISWYARGSSDGTVIGDWRNISTSGEAIPLKRYVQVKIELAGTSTTTPTVNSLLINYTTAFTAAYRLDLGPLGRASNELTGNRLSMEDYEDWLLCADGLRPFILYVDTATQATGTAQDGGANTITLASGASAVDDFYNNAFITITGGVGAGQTRFISDYVGSTKTATVSSNWDTVPIGPPNLLSANQASVETDITGFTKINAGDTISRDTTQYWTGSASLKTVTPGSTNREGFYTSGINASANTQYTGSAYVKGSGDVTLRLYDFTNSVYQDFNMTLSSSWTRFSVTLTTGASPVTDLRLYVLTNSVQALTFYTDGFQIEEGSSATDWYLPGEGGSTYSIGSAVKARNLGIDPPGSALSAADSGVAGNPNGTYYYKVTFVNADGFESNPGSASSSVTVASKKISLTNIPVDSSTGNTTTKRRIYRTAAGGSVYKYVTEIANNTATTYTDNTADASLGALMLDNNNVPGNASIVYPFNSYVFYADNYDLWFSKAGAPDHVPNITGDIQVIPFTGRILDIKSNPMALIPMGEDYVAPITSNSGFIFDSDPTVDTTTLKVVSGNGSLSAFASSICIDPERRENLVFVTRLGLKEIMPGIQDSSLETIPLSYDIQPYFARAVNLDQSAGIFFGAKNYYLFSFEYLPDGGSETEYVTFVCDFRTKKFYGPWTFGMSCYTVANNELYAGDAQNGIVYRMFSGYSYAGANINMIVDLPVISPFGESRTYDFVEFMAVVSADSNTAATQIKPKVDDQEATVNLGTLSSTFAGSERPGHNSIRSRFYQIPLPQGHSLNHRIVDDSTNPLTIYEVTTRGEALPLDD